MIKRVFFSLILIIGLQLATGVHSFAVPAYAQTDPPAAADPVTSDSLDSSSFKFDLNSITHEGIKGTTKQGWIRGGVNYFFERIIGFLAAVIGSLSVLMLSVGGFMMLASAGDETRYTNGKTIAKFSIVGLAVTLSAYIMVSLVQLLIKSIYG